MRIKIIFPLVSIVVLTISSPAWSIFFELAAGGILNSLSSRTSSEDEGVVSALMSAIHFSEYNKISSKDGKREFILKLTPVETEKLLNECRKKYSNQRYYKEEDFINGIR